MITVIFISGCLALLAGYALYGRWLDSSLGVDPSRPTPAHERNDGVDFVPSDTPVLFGHHFSSIAGAGPIVGPVFAALWFGWGPTVLWILAGAILVGGVHDYSALMASIRHRGQSIGEIARQYLSPFTYRAFLVFIYFTLVYVLIVFLDLTAATFAPDDLANPVAVRTGGAVATASMLYIFIAIGFGLIVRTGKMGFKSASLLFVPLVFAALFAGHALPLAATWIPAPIHGHPKFTWAAILLVYCFIASVAPVWILLQPRDYLSSFLLYGCLLGGVAGILVLGMAGQGQIQSTTWQWFRDPELHSDFIFPTLFITVACGAVSGFHSIVASGTSARQLNREEDAKAVAYGGMLVEGLLALIAVCTVMVLKADDPLRNAQPINPVAVFSAGLGRFMGAIGIPQPAGKIFGLLAVSTFLLTTLDTATRLARFILEELLNLRKAGARYFSTALTVALPAVIVFVRIPDPGKAGAHLPAWKAIWPVFGATNQLLAALALLVVFTWLARRRRRRLYVALPMLFMMATTFTGLGQLVAGHLFAPAGQKLVGGICLGLMILATLVVIDTILHWRSSPAEGSARKNSVEA